MAGHSHWARIKRAKAAADARRGRAWSKLARAIIVAARQGGGDPAGNLALRYAIEEARAANMPRDTIERAIRKGTGELASEALEELVYEGYGPGGVAILCLALSDNRARTAGAIKKLFELHGGSLGGTNCVAWMFSKRGLISLPAASVDEERLMQVALETGADDVKRVGEYFEVTCQPADFEAVREGLRRAGLEPESAEIAMVASTTVPLTGQTAQRAMKLIDALEDHEDVQHVYSNLEIPEAEMARLAR